MRHALILLILAGCGAPEPEDPTADLPLLHLAGSSDATEVLVPRLALSHSRSHGTLKALVETTDSRTAMRSMLDGEIDIAVTTRHHTAAEQEQALAYGYDLTAEGARHVVAVNVVAVATHPSNAIEALTYDQVISIFCDGVVDDWQFLGLDAGPLRPMVGDGPSGSLHLVEDFFCGPRGIHDSVERRPAPDLRDLVEEDPEVVTFLSLADQVGRLLALRAEPNAPPVLPSVQNVNRGSYPLYHDIYLYSPGPAQGLAKEFIEWIASPGGQQVVDEARFVPLFLRTERMEGPRPLRETIHFETNSYRPNQRSRARLSLLAEELQDRSGDQAHVVLEGFTDAREDEPLTLAEARAAAVEKLLADRLPQATFERVPRGAINPIAPNTTPYGRLRNRRVQIYLADEEQVPDMLTVGSPNGQNGDVVEGEADEE